MDIKLLIMDVDGTLTDGKIYMSPEGELMKAFNIKDGYAIARLRNYGIEPVILTGRISEIVIQRCKELGIREVYQGVEDKAQKLNELYDKYGYSTANAAYIGDDLNDAECMSLCGCVGAPSDAVAEILERADYVCRRKGGEGAVREFIEYLVKNNDK